MSKRQPSRSTVRLMPPTHGVLLEHDHRVARLGQPVGGGQSGRSPADDDHRGRRGRSASGRRLRSQGSALPCAVRSVSAGAGAGALRCRSVAVMAGARAPGATGGPADHPPPTGRRPGADGGRRLHPAVGRIVAPPVLPSEPRPGRRPLRARRRRGRPAWRSRPWRRRTPPGPRPRPGAARWPSRRPRPGGTRRARSARTNPGWCCQRHHQDHGGEQRIGVRQAPPGNDHQDGAECDPGQVGGAAQVVAVEGGEPVVPHGVERHGQLPPVAALLLDGEGEPGVAEAVADPSQVGAGAGHRGEQGRAAAATPRAGDRPARSAGTTARAPPARRAAPPPVGRPGRQAGGRRPPPTAGADAQEGRRRRSAAARRPSRPAPASTPTGRGPAATPTDGPTPVAEVVAHEEQQSGHGQPGPRRWPPPRGHVRAHAGNWPSTRPASGEGGRSAGTRGRPRRTRGRRSAGTTRRPTPTGRPGPAGGPRGCRAGAERTDRWATTSAATTSRGPRATQAAPRRRHRPGLGTGAPGSRPTVRPSWPEVGRRPGPPPTTAVRTRSASEAGSADIGWKNSGLSPATRLAPW